MAGLAGILNIEDSERAFVNTIGQQLVFDAVNQRLDDHNVEMEQALSVFVERKTEKFKMRHLLPGGGYLDRMGRQAPAAAHKRYGSYDVAFQLGMWGKEQAGSRVDLAYLSIAELDAHLKSILQADLQTMRWRVLLALFEDTNLTFDDPIHGNLTVTRLANTDGSLYPPVLGSITEADDDHYIDAGYAVNTIADAVTPHITLRDEIAEHYGGIGSAGRNFVYFHGGDQTAYLAALTNYVAVVDYALMPGDDQDRITSALPNVPGRVHGRHGGVWLSEWDTIIPDTFGLCILLEVPAPLLMRVDPADVGLGSGGLVLVAEDVNHPMRRASYERRFGFGVLNRLSAAIIMIAGANGGYVPPAGYTEVSD